MVDRHDDTPSWIEVEGFFSRVTASTQAKVLLNDPSLHVDFLSLFRGVGAGSGIAGEALRTSLLSLNGERHKTERAALSAPFTPRQVESIRPLARSTAIDLVSAFSETRPVAFVEEFCVPYLEETTGRFVGFPEGAMAELRGPLAQIAHATSDLPRFAAEWDAGIAELMEYSLGAIRHGPANSDSVLGHVRGAMTRGEVSELSAATFITTLLSAGQEPTGHQLGLMMHTLADQPEVWDAVGKGDLDAAVVVEESLRFRSTNLGVERVANAPVECAGHRFRKGAHIIIDIAACNRDAHRFARPDEFDLDANRGPHLAFGFGPHYCLGAALARVQLQEALAVLAARCRPPVVLEATEKEGGGLAGFLRLLLEMTTRPD